MGRMKLLSGSLQATEILETSSAQGNGTTALDIARERKKSEVVDLLERFVHNPAQTRQEIKQKLNLISKCGLI